MLQGRHVENIMLVFVIKLIGEHLSGTYLGCPNILLRAHTVRETCCERLLLTHVVRDMSQDQDGQHEPVVTIPGRDDQ